MKQNMWIWNHYATNTYIEKGGRHYWFAKYLLEKNYKPTIFCASTIHNSDESIDTQQKKHITNIADNIPYVFIKAPAYNGNSIKRIFNMLSFYKSLFPVSREYAKSNGKPDVILASSVHPLTLVAGIKIAKRFKVHCVCEIRDLWPESFVAYGLISRNNIIMKFLYAGEKWIYKKADKLIFTMEGGRDYIIKKGWDTGSGGTVDLKKVFHINNGVDLEAFEYNREHYQIEDEDLNEDNVFKVVYAGSIRMVNKVGLLLDAAKILKEKEEDSIKFLIWGDGDEKNALESRAKEEGLTNVCFKGRVEKKYIPYIASRSQLNIALGETLPLYSFGGSMNKMFDYFAAAKPVLFTFKLGYSIIDKYGAGQELSDSSPLNIADNILYFKNLPADDYNKYCVNSRKAARDYDFARLTERLIEIIDIRI
ncbi:MAG: glycosyltransferase family 4 protein [Christensenellales bacterium]|jgi:glycosyltransferase involved in cell wall biosynthesis